LVESEPGVREPLTEAYTFLRALDYITVTTSIVLMGIGGYRWENESKQSQKKTEMRMVTKYYWESECNSGIFKGGIQA